MTSLYNDLPTTQCEAASQKTAGFVAELPLSILGRIKRGFGQLVVWQHRYEMRQHLLALDARLLADMGLSEAERRQEALKPFWKA